MSDPRNGDVAVWIDASDGRRGEAGSGGRRSAMLIALLVLLLGSLFAGARLHANDGDPTAFVAAGDKVTSPSQAPELSVKEDSLGYDGQYFHRLARNPLSREAREFGTRLDRPAYRHQRIAYPAVVWALTGGRADLVPWALIGVNLTALTALGYLAARLAQGAGRPAWWGLVVAGWPGLLVALAYDLSEVLAAALLAATLLALRRRQWHSATVLLVAAGLTRETTLVVALAIVAAAVVRRWPPGAWARALTGDGPTVPVAVGLIPLGIAGGFRVALTWWWADVSTTGPDIPSFVGVPFAALARQLGSWLVGGDVVGYYQLFQVVVLIAVVFALGRTLFERSAGLPHERVALLATLVVLSMLPVWDRSVVFLRWADEAVLVGFVVALHASRFPIRPVLRGVGALAATTAIVWITI
jgi:hypothetical protein